VRWCEEIRMFGGVFIGGNGNIGYNYNKALFGLAYFELM